MRKRVASMKPCAHEGHAFDVVTARSDLQNLGIHIDADVVARIHRLGTDKTFETIRAVSSILSIDNGGTTHTCNLDHNILLDGKSPKAKVSQGMYHKDERRFQQIENLFACLDIMAPSPSRRPLKERAILCLNDIYRNSPNRFICGLLGLRTHCKTDEAYGMGHLAKRRYMDSDTFAAALRRMIPDKNIATAVDYLVSIFTEEMESQGAVIVMVDLWLFVSRFRRKDDLPLFGAPFPCSPSKMAGNTNMTSTKAITKRVSPIKIDHISRRQKLLSRDQAKVVAASPNPSLTQISSSGRLSLIKKKVAAEKQKRDDETRLLLEARKSAPSQRPAKVASRMKTHRPTESKISPESTSADSYTSADRQSRNSSPTRSTTQPLHNRNQDLSRANSTKRSMNKVHNLKGSCRDESRAPDHTTPVKSVACLVDMLKRSNAEMRSVTASFSSSSRSSSNSSTFQCRSEERKKSSSSNHVSSSRSSSSSKSARSAESHNLINMVVRINEDMISVRDSIGSKTSTIGSNADSSSLSLSENTQDRIFLDTRMEDGDRRMSRVSTNDSTDETGVVSQSVTHISSDQNHSNTNTDFDCDVSSISSDSTSNKSSCKLPAQRSGSVVEPTVLEHVNDREGLLFSRVHVKDKGQIPTSFWDTRLEDLASAHRAGLDAGRHERRMCGGPAIEDPPTPHLQSETPSVSASRSVSRKPSMEIEISPGNTLLKDSLCDTVSSSTCKRDIRTDTKAANDDGILLTSSRRASELKSNDRKNSSIPPPSYPKSSLYPDIFPNPVTQTPVKYELKRPQSCESQSDMEASLQHLQIEQVARVHSLDSYEDTPRTHSVATEHDDSVSVSSFATCTNALEALEDSTHVPLNDRRPSVDQYGNTTLVSNIRPETPPSFDDLNSERSDNNDIDLTFGGISVLASEATERTINCDVDLVSSRESGDVNVDVDTSCFTDSISGRSGHADISKSPHHDSASGQEALLDEFTGNPSTAATVGEEDRKGTPFSSPENAENLTRSAFRFPLRNRTSSAKRYLQSQSPARRSQRSIDGDDALRKNRMRMKGQGMKGHSIDSSVGSFDDASAVSSDAAKALSRSLSNASTESSKRMYSSDDDADFGFCGSLDLLSVRAEKGRFEGFWRSGSAKAQRVGSIKLLNIEEELTVEQFLGQVSPPKFVDSHPETVAESETMETPPSLAEDACLRISPETMIAKEKYKSPIITPRVRRNSSKKLADMAAKALGMSREGTPRHKVSHFTFEGFDELEGEADASQASEEDSSGAEVLPIQVPDVPAAPTGKQPSLSSPSDTETVVPGIENVNDASSRGKYMSALFGSVSENESESGDNMHSREGTPAFYAESPAVGGADEGAIESVCDFGVSPMCDPEETSKSSLVLDKDNHKSGSWCVYDPTAPTAPTEFAVAHAAVVLDADEVQMFQPLIGPGEGEAKDIFPNRLPLSSSQHEIHSDDFSDASTSMSANMPIGMSELMSASSVSDESKKTPDLSCVSASVSANDPVSDTVSGNPKKQVAEINVLEVDHSRKHIYAFEVDYVPYNDVSKAASTSTSPIARDHSAGALVRTRDFTASDSSYGHSDVSHVEALGSYIDVDTVTEKTIATTDFVASDVSSGTGMKSHTGESAEVSMTAASPNEKGISQMLECPNNTSYLQILKTVDFITTDAESTVNSSDMMTPLGSIKSEINELVQTGQFKSTENSSFSEHIGTRAPLYSSSSLLTSSYANQFELPISNDSQPSSGLSSSVASACSVSDLEDDFTDRDDRWPDRNNVENLSLNQVVTRRLLRRKSSVSVRSQSTNSQCSSARSSTGLSGPSVTLSPQSTMTPLSDYDHFERLDLVEYRSPAHSRIHSQHNSADVLHLLDDQDGNEEKSVHSESFYRLQHGDETARRGLNQRDPSDLDDSVLNYLLLSDNVDDDGKDVLAEDAFQVVDVSDRTESTQALSDKSEYYATPTDGAARPVHTGDFEASTKYTQVSSINLNAHSHSQMQSIDTINSIKNDNVSSRLLQTGDFVEKESSGEDSSAEKVANVIPRSRSSSAFNYFEAPHSVSSDNLRGRDDAVHAVGIDEFESTSKSSFGEKIMISPDGVVKKTPHEASEDGVTQSANTGDFDLHYRNARRSIPWQEKNGDLPRSVDENKRRNDPLFFGQSTPKESSARDCLLPEPLSPLPFDDQSGIGIENSDSAISVYGALLDMHGDVNPLQSGDSKCSSDASQNSAPSRQGNTGKTSRSQMSGSGRARLEFSETHTRRIPQAVSLPPNNAACQSSNKSRETVSEMSFNMDVDLVGGQDTASASMSHQLSASMITSSTNAAIDSERYDHSESSFIVGSSSVLVSEATERTISCNVDLVSSRDSGGADGDVDTSYLTESVASP